MVHLKAITFLMVGALVNGELTTDNMCMVTSGAKVILNTHRTDKGNWVTKVDMERGGGKGQQAAMFADPWTVAVDSDTRTCEGAASVLHASLTITAPPRKVPSDYELFPDLGYYKFHTDVNTWEGARQTCAKEGAHLAIINSEAEAEAMKKMFAKHPTIPGASSNEYAWIGVQRIKKEYFTIFGETLQSTGFTRWHAGEPHLGEADDCILVTRPTGGLADVTCAWKVAYFCELTM